MTARVLRFPTTNAADLPGALRWYADAIEAGDFTPGSMVLVAHHGHRFLPTLAVLGAPVPRLELAGVLDAARMVVQGSAFNYGGEG